MGNSQSKNNRKNRKTEPSTDKELPPPYDRQPGGIKASDVPQWRWSNKQCKEWLTEVLIEYGSLERNEAERQAQQFTGFGPSLFAHKIETWTQWFGPNGNSIQCLIFAMGNEKGAIPPGFRFKPDEAKK